VGSYCEFDVEPLSFIKCWETMSGLTSGGLSSSAQLHLVS
jgi:hypothetical protein